LTRLCNKSNIKTYSVRFDDEGRNQVHLVHNFFINEETWENTTIRTVNFNRNSDKLIQ